MLNVMPKKTVPTAGIYKATSHSVEISVEPEYLDDQSSKQENYYVWAYHVTIKNLGSETIQLMHRHWKITDARGHTEEVRGPGVVGEQPVLRPNDTFSYTSGTYLATLSGIMRGAYEMEKEDGELIEVTIPSFSLDIPGQTFLLN